MRPTKAPKGVPADLPRPDDPPPPQQSAEDTDRCWGEWPDPDDDERFGRDRPPHWNDS